MGVTGLWRLIEPSGKPVPLETLENKVLAVDVSIWLHQAIKGFQDSQGAPLPNAHLLGIYHRVCKLLYFRVKPVFVFDGGVPMLKKQTIAKRNQQKVKKLSEAESIQKQLLTTLLKHSAVNKVLSEKTKATLAIKTSPSKAPSNAEDLYKLPPTEFDSTLSSDEEGTTSESIDSSPTKHWDFHTIDEKSPHFKALPADVRHEILTEVKETRKQSSWGRLHELPKKSDDFSGFQMKRLLKRFSVQASLEEAEKEMGGHSLSLAELEALMTDQGVVTTNSSVGSRIASDENTRFLLIKDVKKAMIEAKKQKDVLEAIQEEGEKQEENNEPKCIEEPSKQSLIENAENTSVEIQENVASDVEFQKNLEKAIELSLQDVPSTSKDCNRPKSKHNFSFLENFNDADFGISSESEEDFDHLKDKNKVLASAKSYMMEYSGLTPSEIAKIIDGNSGLPNENRIANISTTCRTTTLKHNVPDVTISDAQSAVLVEDDIVSSSTSTVSKSKIVDANEDEQIDSSTAIHNINGYTNDNEVEVISDASSCCSDDFLEVSEQQNISGLEILVKPEESLEDDLFSDIFSDKKDENINAIKDVIQTEKFQVDNKVIIISDEPTKKEIKLISAPLEVSNGQKVVEHKELITISDEAKIDVSGDKKEIELILAHTEEISNGQSKKVKFNDDVMKSKEITKEERTQGVVAEFIKPGTSKEAKSNVQTKNDHAILTTDQLQLIEQDLRQEKADLIHGKLSKERMAGSLTEQIYQEAQELLQLFGVPFIVAPLEAEAQCAFLDDINLTDGTITDDSDIWLFGGKTVYKNFFNQQKHVMEFRSENIQHNFRLTREQMILLALLVGSDYTVGLQGIGPVTALEILAAFPPSKAAQQQLISGLEQFREWLSGEKAVGPGKTSLRNKLKNVTFTDSFPSLQVVQAYLEPTIDSSKEPFSWDKPDIVGLTEFARQKFGWTRVKSEEILKPVLKRLNEFRIQKSIKDYFQTKRKVDSGEAESKMSKRVKQAVNRIGREPGNSDEDEKQKKSSKRNKKNKSTKDVTETETDMQSVIETINNVVAEYAYLSSDEDIQILKQTRIQSKKKMEQIKSDVKKEIEQQIKKPRTIASLHKKDIIPQKEQDRINAVRSKMKAIEVLRKSKKAPRLSQKRKLAKRPPKEDAELSESSSD